MIKVELNKHRISITTVAKDWFEAITKLPKNIRPDDKERTGIQVLVREPGTRNLIYFSVFEPSEAAKFFSIEKAVRSHILGDYSSENSGNSGQMQFPGSITVRIQGVEIQASVSGLKAEEDVVVSVMILAGIFNLSPALLCKEVLESGGKLPASFFDKKSYFYPFVSAKSVLDVTPL